MGATRMVWVRKLLNFILIAVIIFYSINRMMNITYANTVTSTPDVTVTIDESGKTSFNGNLFGEDLWYPGKTKSGVIRIYNNFKELQVNDLDLRVILGKVKEGTDREFAYNSFLENMKFTLNQKRLFFFNNTLVKDTSLTQMQYIDEENGQNDLNAETIEGFKITKNDYEDLNYNLHMDEKSGDELESLTATIEIALNIGESIE